MHHVLFSGRLEFQVTRDQATLFIVGQSILRKGDKVHQFVPVIVPRNLVQNFQHGNFIVVEAQIERGILVAKSMEACSPRQDLNFMMISGKVGKNQMDEIFFVRKFEAPVWMQSHDCTGIGVFICENFKNPSFEPETILDTGLSQLIHPASHGGH